MPLAYIEFIGGGLAPANPPPRPEPAPPWGGPVDPGWGYRPPVDPGYGRPGLPAWGGPVDPGYGYRPPVDPGYGRPSWGPVDPGWGRPGPGYPSTGPIWGGGYPSHPIYRPDKPTPLPPEITPPELPPPYSEQLVVLVYTPGQGWQMQAYPQYPSQGLPPTAAPKPAA